jgi:MoxR-like ATPase
MLETITHSATVIDKIKNTSAHIHSLHAEIGKVIVGQQDVINHAIIALLCNGHILLEGVPGVAKTTLIKALTKTLGLNFNRIQFTPDLLPADLIGSLIYNPKTHEFETRKGPIFAHLIIADEINRAPAKVQSALLEAMQEQQVTIGSTTFYLDKPFLVFATQNPLEQEGTYRLPEAQVDRFMFKLLVEYPNIKEEREILNKTLDVDRVSQIITQETLQQAQDFVASTYVDSKISDYIVNIVFATRKPESFGLKEIKPFIRYGVSPRATLALQQAAKAHAFLKHRHFVTPDDVKAICSAVLRHRIALSYQAESEEVKPDYIVHKILTTIPSP